MADVFLQRAGEGPAVLFLHGTPTPWDVLRPIAERCSARTTLLAALPGYGVAPAWDVHPTVDDIADAIERAVAQLGVRELAIVGFSGGAYHALHVALRGTLRVHTLVLLGALADVTPETADVFRQFAALLRTNTPLEAVVAARFLSPAFAAAHPDACTRVGAWLRATTPENLARELEAVAAGPSFSPRLGAWGGRLLLRSGELDAACPAATAKAVATVAKDATLQIVPGAGHALLEEDRAATIQSVVDFLAR